MKAKDILIYAVSVCALFGAWAIAARVAASPFILPDPLSVLADGARLVADGSFAAMLGTTCARSLRISRIPRAVGVARILRRRVAVVRNGAQTLDGRYQIDAGRIVYPYRASLVWFFLCARLRRRTHDTPLMTEAIANGVRSSDPKLLEMARVYRFSARDRILHIQVPSAMPFFLGGAGASLGLTWKVVVAGEILSVPKFGIGAQCRRQRFISRPRACFRSL
jgi:NitT/TauT family transport system permease protein